MLHFADDNLNAKKSAGKTQNKKAQRLSVAPFKLAAEAPILSMRKTLLASAVRMFFARKARMLRAMKTSQKCGQLHVTLGLHVTI